MKIRNGFVSNSSSASFIVKIQLSKNDFLNCLISEFEISKEGYLSILNDRLITIQKDKQSEDGVFSLEYYNDDINETSQLIQNIKNSESNEELLELYLRAHRIDVNDGLNGWTEINAWTSMFNDYNDMPSDLKQLLICFMFEHPEIKLICNLRND